MIDETEGLRLDQLQLDQLRQWAVVTEKEIEGIRADIVPLEQRLGTAKERLDLIRRLIRLTEGAQSTPRCAENPNTSLSADGATAPLVVKQDLEAHLEQIL